MHVQQSSFNRAVLITFNFDTLYITVAIIFVFFLEDSGGENDNVCLFSSPRCCLFTVAAVGNNNSRRLEDKLSLDIIHGSPRAHLV